MAFIACQRTLFCALDRSNMPEHWRPARFGRFRSDFLFPVSVTRSAAPGRSGSRAARSRRGAGEFGFGGGLRVQDADDILRHEAAEQFLARGGVELARLAADLGAALEHRGLERPEMLPCDRRQALR